MEEIMAPEIDATPHSDSDDYDTDGADCPSLPRRSAIKCNDKLAAALPKIVNLRGTDFEGARKLAFE